MGLRAPPPPHTPWSNFLLTCLCLHLRAGLCGLRPTCLTPADTCLGRCYWHVWCAGTPSEAARHGPQSIATPGEGGPSSRCELGEAGGGSGKQARPQFPPLTLVQNTFFFKKVRW